jgi:hypothetical protein
MPLMSFGDSSVAGMTPIAESALDWLDAIGWCECPKGQRTDQCPRCREARRQQRAQQEQLAPKRPRVYAGAQTASDRKLVW